MHVEWFYAEQGQQKGPVTFEQLQALAGSGELKPTDLVWTNGMPQWAPAGAQAGLFPAGAHQPPPPDDGPPAPPPYDEMAAYAADPYAERRRYGAGYGGAQSYARPAPSGGMSAGGKIALMGGGAAMLLLFLCCGVVGVMVMANSNSNERTWRLGTNEHQVWTLPFKRGDQVVLTVTSNGPSDMDLFVFDDKNKMNSMLTSKLPLEKNVYLCLRYDNGLSKDCEVKFTAPATQDYYVLLVNRLSDDFRRNGSNSGKLVFLPASK